MPELKPIPGYEGMFSITSDGRVWSHERDVSVRGTQGRTVGGRWLTIIHDQYGYLLVDLTVKRRTKRWRIHRLVAMTWNAKVATPGQVVNHINGIKNDNRVENLEWCDQSHNTKHSFDIGLRKISDKLRARTRLTGRSRRKLTYDGAEKLRADYSRGETMRALSGKYGISLGVVCLIINRKTYAID